VEESKRLSVDTLDVNLTLTPRSDTENTKNYAPKIPKKGDTPQLTISIKKEATFTLEVGAQQQDTTTNTLIVYYQPSEGNASIWDGRKTALVLNADNKDNLPSDAYLSIDIGNNHYTIYQKTKGQFIIPLPTTLSTQNSTNVTVKLCSYNLGTEAKYVFNAMWYVSPTLAGSSPLNGWYIMNDGTATTYKKFGEEQITFNGTSTETPSLRVDGTKHLYQSSEKLSVELKSELTSNAKIFYELLKKDESGNWKSQNSPSQVQQNKGNWSYNLSNLESGSYCVKFSVQQGTDDKNMTLLIKEVPYYFIILDTSS
jgi:hypothetical protein